jgi:F-type H+-transporting ATPase subunit delta
MARRETAARRYAEAAFEIGSEDGSLDEWERDLKRLRGLLEQPDLARVAQHPAIPYGDKERLLRRIVGRSVRAEPLSLVLLMVRRGRPGAVGPTVERFEELVRRRRGVVRAEVRTALALDDGQRARIVEQLRALTGEQVEITESVDESLIGGIAVRVGDRLWDASVRNRLERLRARLAAV